jgi:HSP20 family molecular chaperone IbpA
MADEMQDSTGQPAQEPQGQAGQKMPAEQGRGERTRARRTFRPQVDIYETEQGLMLLADVPGAKPEGLEITLERHVLTIRAEVEDHAPEGYSPVYQEYEVGDFECQFTLSGDFDTEKIEANLVDGVLRLTIPRAAEAAPRTIKVKAAGASS